MADVKAAIYARLSRDDSGEELGVTRQRDDCRKLIRSREWTAAGEHVDNDISASGKRRRPGFEALLVAIEAGDVGAVVAWDLSRLTRNARDTLRLLELGEKRGLTVALVRGSDMDLGTPAGRLAATILAGVARHEIDQKSDRQRRAAQQAAEDGKWIGGRRAFGYEADGVTIREDEAAVLRQAFADVLAGRGLGPVAAEMGAAGFVTPQLTRQGAPSKWTAQTLRPVLLNPRYCGLRTRVTAEMLERMNPTKARLNAIVGPAQWPPLVSEEAWRGVVARLTHPDRRTAPKSGQALLTGVALCGVCGGLIHGGRQNKHRGSWKTYRCREAPGRHVIRKQEPVDDYVDLVMMEVLATPEAQELLLPPDNSPAAAELHTQIQSARHRLRGLAPAFAADPDADPRDLAAATGALRRKIAGMEEELEKLTRGTAFGPFAGGRDPIEVWASLATDQRRIVIDALATVVLMPPGRGRRNFDPSTVKITPKRRQP